MSDYLNFVNFLTAAQRGRTNTTPKATPRTKATPPRSPATNNSDDILRREIINIFNGR